MRLLLFSLLLLLRGSIAERAASCADILPFYQLDTGVRFNTATLFDLVDGLPAGRGREESRALISITRDRCGLTREEEDNGDEMRRRFRSACFVIKQTFAHSRKPPPSIDDASSADEAAVRAALVIANEALRKSRLSCDAMCPCVNHGKICPTNIDEDGKCIIPSVAISTDNDKMNNKVTMVTVTSEPVASTPESDADVVIQSTPEGEHVAATTAANKEEASPSSTATTGTSSFGGGGGSVLDLTPMPLADTSTEMVGRRRMSIGAIAGIGVAGVICIAAVALLTVSQVSFRRRHSEEIDQWRNAFRVVED